ncbi:MAG TPA: zeta toxin family protein [Capsulimonadaceae bacterium]|nr:zeta toxin family protein [Capsulimonadaceae bacterium]
MGTPTIIFLNGTSSSGKTSIAKALQGVLDEPYLYLTADIRKSLLPPYREGVDWDIEETLDNLRYGFYACLAALAAHGSYVITDQAVENAQWIIRCARSLKETRSYLIGVRCPFEIAEQRERERGDRTIGLVREHFDLVHNPGIYDLEVNTSVLSSEECAQKIKEHVSSREPTAFLQLSGLPGI